MFAAFRTGGADKSAFAAKPGSRPGCFFGLPAEGASLF